MEIKDPPCGSPGYPWDVKTYGGKGAGNMTLHTATLKSDNSVYAQLTSDLGPDKVKETARMMGIKSKLLGFCAESLGGLDRRRLAARDGQRLRDDRQRRLPQPPARDQEGRDRRARP